MADYVLPEEIIMSILSLLPVKTLVRFKVVCKQWQSLVTNPDFIKLHYNRFSVAPKTCCGNSQKLNGRYPRVGVSEIMAGDFYLASCRGLIYMARPRTHPVRNVLWNPATRLCKLLPQPTTNAIAASLGLGCNEEGDDHNVVRIHCKKENEMNVFVEVYSSKADSRGTVNVGFPFRSVLMGHVAVVKGNPHWIVYDQDEEMVLLRFDATRMVFKKIRLNEMMKGQDNISFADLEGSLGGMYCVSREGGWLERMDVWEHVEEQEEWVMKWRLEGEALRGLKVDVCGDYSWRKGKIVGRCMNGSLFEYDVKNGSVRVFGVEKGRRGWLQIRVYEESLAHVTGMIAARFERDHETDL